MSKPRVLVDTNVLLSAGMKQSTVPAFCLRWIRQHGILFASTAMLAELRRTLAYPKLRRLIDDLAAGTLIAILEAAERIEVTEVPAVCADPQDDQVLALAVAAGADCIVSGDRKHLLPLHPYRGIPILTPTDFLLAFARA